MKFPNESLLRFSIPVRDSTIEVLILSTGTEVISLSKKTYWY